MNTFNEQFAYFGETELMNQTKTVFFCPFDVTDDIFKYVREWVSTLDPMAGVVVCGNSSGVERYTLRLLLNKGFAVILPLATTIPENLEELNLGWKLSNTESLCILNKALDEHRLFIVSSKENVSVSVPTGRTLSIRNRWMLEAGDRFVVSAYRPFDYYDHLLLGRQVQYLCNPADSTEQADQQEQQKKEALRMGWDIYRKLKEDSTANDVAVLQTLVQRYLQLDIEHPSLLHSLVLMVIAQKYSDRSDFDFMGFVRQWSLQNLRPEDWQCFKNKDGKYLPSLAERCMARMLRCMPSRNLMSIDYSRPFDTRLMHEWIDAAINRFPRNKRHMKNALRLAYYEHDGEKINYYKQQLAV